MELPRRLQALAVASALVFSTGVANAVVDLFGGNLAVAEASEASPAGLPAGSPVAGRPGAEASALTLVRHLGALADLPGPAGSSVACPDDRMVVSWVEPTGSYKRGAYVQPIGPAPTAETNQVNGVVLCEGSDFAFVGFEAAWNGATWMVALTPELDDGEGATSAVARFGEPLPSPMSIAMLSKSSRWSGRWSAAIEPLAAYEPQSTCDPTAKPAMVAFRALIMQAYPASGDSGIVRNCSIGGRSEHKEGRAWDWSVRVDDPVGRQAASDVIGWLLATDEFGNRFAMARRLGIMYVIWDQQIWSSYSPDMWRPYNGPSPHTDHVHISMGRAGAAGLTSFWQGWDLPAVVAGLRGQFDVLPRGGGAGIGFNSFAGPVAVGLLAAPGAALPVLVGDGRGAPFASGPTTGERVVGGAAEVATDEAAETTDEAAETTDETADAVGGATEAPSIVPGEPDPDQPGTGPVGGPPTPPPPPSAGPSGPGQPPPSDPGQPPGSTTTVPPLTLPPVTLPTRPTLPSPPSVPPTTLPGLPVQTTLPVVTLPPTIPVTVPESIPGL